MFNSKNIEETLVALAYLLKTKSLRNENISFLEFYTDYISVLKQLRDFK